MNSMERAPEPTMEEILASIRRIISDDEANAARQSGSSASRQDVASPLAGEDEPDTKIIDDIARVLSGNSVQGSEEDEVLDLTKEFDAEEGAHSAAPEIMQSAPSRAEGVSFAAARVEEISFDVAPAPENTGRAPAQEMSATPSESATAQAASALEQAIAALRAGELPRFAPEPESEPEAAAEPQAAPEPEPTPQAAAEAILEQSAASEPAPETEAAPEQEIELLLTELDVAIPTEEPETEDEPRAAESSSFWPSSWSDQTGASRADETNTRYEPPSAEYELAEPAPEPVASRQNGVGAHRPSAYEAFSESSGKSLEDSVKEMLRPLLRQWLDEHMSRVLEAVLRDELKDAEMRRRFDEQRERH